LARLQKSIQKHPNPEIRRERFKSFSRPKNIDIPYKENTKGLDQSKKCNFRGIWGGGKSKKTLKTRLNIWEKKSDPKLF